MKTILAILSLALASCAYGPDWSPDVQTAAASFGGPVYSPSGALMSTGGGGSSATRKTMLHD